MIEYHRDVPVDLDEPSVTATIDHVVWQLAAVADEDDDPRYFSNKVRVSIKEHPENSKLMRITGRLNAEPKARYLERGFDPFDGIDDELVEAGAPDGEI